MIKQIIPIDLHWPTLNPFLFCAHHFDHYPIGNQNLGVDEHHFKGREMGSDFTEKNGFRLYHGEEVPGFPVHPHRGFETITIVRQGYADHADSLGAAGRYGEGDVQWMTAGSGVQHSEMFPLLHQDKTNTVELFQIWLNLPKNKKMVSPDFKMIWANQIPQIKIPQGEVTLVCGDFQSTHFNPAPTNSYAQQSDSHVQIKIIKIHPHQTFVLDQSTHDILRVLYFFDNKYCLVNHQQINGKNALVVETTSDITIQTQDTAVEFLVLEGTPINEPVAQHGPFVMNSRDEIIKAFEDYQKTQFGGWPWPRQDMTHGPEIKRFAKYPDGKIEKP